MPTTDVRTFAAVALAELFGIERALIERDVFPGLEIGAKHKFLA